MGKEQKSRPISLTNKTAVKLRHTAQNVRRAWLIAMGVTAMLATVTAVYLGIIWLPAVPLTLLAGAIVIAVMMLISRSQYLLLVSQAICTEAASRQMREQAGENERRRRAIEELAAMRADVRDAGKGAGTERYPESLLFDLLTGREDESAARDKRAEDDDLYDARQREEEAAKDDEADEDLYAPKAKNALPQKKAASAARSENVIQAPTGRTKPVARVTARPEEAGGADGAPRRRRRQQETAPASALQLIRGEQAK